MPFDLTIIEPDSPEFPAGLRDMTLWATSPKIWAIGNRKILGRPLVGFFCSIRCPGDIILRTYDMARSLRDAGVAVIGGFHSPIEKDCFDLLLSGIQPIIICPARSIEHMRIRTEYRQSLDEGKLLFLSPFNQSQRRPTLKTSHYRNLFVAALSARVFVAHAGHGSKTEAFCREILSWEKPVYTFENDYNKTLIEMGVQPVNMDNVSGWAN